MIRKAEKHKDACGWANGPARTEPVPRNFEMMKIQKRRRRRKRREKKNNMKGKTKERLLREAKRERGSGPLTKS